MSQKRQQGGEGCSLDGKRRRKSPSFKSVVLDVMNIRKLQQLVEPVLEPLIRRVVKEELDLALRKYSINTSRNDGKDTHPSELQLKFVNAISLPVFTASRIEGEGCTSLEVALVDTHTGEVVSSGLESSSKVEIVVLEGDFDGDNWTLEEFSSNIARAREGKKPLVSGDVIMNLKDGIGSVGDILFTDNSSWTRSRKFRLGARFIIGIDGIRIREAKSEPFIVRDHRGELYKKHYPPSLCDEVWRLEKIGKDGAFHRRLRKERVNTVRDFLILLSLDPTRLRNILGTGMPTKMWELTVDHAQTCVLDKKLYFYNASNSLQKNGVVFNVVGQVMGMFSNGDYVPNDKLSETEKADALELVISASKEWEKIVTFDDEFSLDLCPSSSLPIVQSSSNLPPHQDLSSIQSVTSPDFMQSVYPIAGLSSDNDYLHCINPLELSYDQPALSFPFQDSDNLVGHTDPITQAFCENERYFETGSNLEFLSSDLLQDAIRAFMPRSPVSTAKARSQWNILLSVLRWIFSIRRIVARKNRFRDIPRLH